MVSCGYAMGIDDNQFDGTVSYPLATTNSGIVLGNLGHMLQPRIEGPMLGG